METASDLLTGAGGRAAGNLIDTLPNGDTINKLRDKGGKENQRGQVSLFKMDCRDAIFCVYVGLVNDVINRNTLQDADL